MEELDVYLEEIIKLFVEWANSKERNSDELSDTIIRKFVIKEQKDQCMIKSICFSFEVVLNLDDYADSEEVHEYAGGFVGVNLNIISDIASGEWNKASDRLCNL